MTDSRLTFRQKSIAFEMREKSVGAGDSSVTIPFLVCLPLEEAGFVNAFSTRLGGVSPFPSDSLHFSLKTDDVKNVRENKRRLLSALDCVNSTILTSHQTHSTDQLIVRANEVGQFHRNDSVEPPGDALVTVLPNVLVGVKTADCVSLLIGDPETSAVAAIHAGWKGTLGRITEKTVSRMKNEFHIDPKTCLAAMGPSACAECYEVGSAVTEPFKNEFPYGEGLFRASPENAGKFFFDIRYANALQLVEVGVSPKNIFGADECTMHQNDLFFSHRKEGRNNDGKTGRNLSLVGRKN